MTTERWDDEKLDRLAEIVMGIASEVKNVKQDLAETKQIAENNTRAIQASNERLDRLENIVESNTRATQATNESLDSLKQIVESNARAIQATNESIDSLNDKLEKTIDVVNGNARAIQSIADALGEAAEDRQEFKQSMAQQQETINEQQSEIRGLQRENRLLIENWLNQQNPEDNPDAS